MNVFGIQQAVKTTAFQMGIDATSGMSDGAKLDFIRVLLDDIPADLLAEFANEAGRIAHMKQRNEQ